MEKEKLDKPDAYFERRSGVPALVSEVRRLTARIAELEAENSALSANTCHDGYADDSGNHRCGYQDALCEKSEIIAEQLRLIRDQRERIDAARARIDTMLADISREWRPIETAPEDGRYYLVWADDGVHKAWQVRRPPNHGNYWLLEDDNEVFPTHWMPLPGRPEVA